MLLISRSIGQTIVIEHLGELLTLSIRRLSENRVQLGFSGPEEMRVIRGELLIDEECE